MSEISLHEELKQTKKKFTKKSLIQKNSSPTLLLAETNEIRETEALRAMGLVPEVEEDLAERGRQIVRKNLEDKYDTLYSGEEIKDLCIKYGLRFLPTKHYSGPLTEDFGNKIVEFNEIHGVNSNLSEHEAMNYKILAPSEAFGKSSRKSHLSTDPILFYKVDDNDNGTSSHDSHTKEQYYTIVYEWGNKFNTWRMITSYKNRSTESNLIHTFFTVFSLSLIVAGLIGFRSTPVAMASSMAVSFIATIIKMSALTGSNSSFGNNIIARNWNKEKTII